MNTDPNASECIGAGGDLEGNEKVWLDYYFSIG